MASIEFRNGSSSVKQIIDKAFQMTLVRHCGRYLSKIEMKDDRTCTKNLKMLTLVCFCG